jgi:hypothetical protein
MVFILRFCALLLVAPSLLAGDNSATVNERIPVRKAELEAHWQVDCTASWARLTETLDKSREGVCSSSPQLHREIKLCSFIYQPPGEESNHSCPDFHSAVDYLDRVNGQNGCAALANFLQEQVQCIPSNQGD